MLKIEISSFGLSSTGILICPNLKVVPEGRCIQVFDKDNLLTKVTVEPFVLLFDVGVWVSSACKVGFTSSAYAPVPLSTSLGSGEGSELKHSIEIESLGEFANLGDLDVAFVYSFNCSYFQYVFVPSSYISLNVALSRTYAEGPGTFYASVFFLAVVDGCLDIARDLKVGLRALFAHTDNRRLVGFGEYDDELEVYCALLTSFYLSDYIGGFVLGMPLL